MISHRQYITYCAVIDNSCAGWRCSNLSDSTFLHVQVHRNLWPMLWCPPKAISVPLCLPSFCLSCLFLLTSLTFSSKWAWHASRCLTKVCVCVCGRCLGRWDLLWDTLISSKPKPRQGGAGQVSGTTQYTYWLIFSLRVKSILYATVTSSFWCPPLTWPLSQVASSLPWGLCGRKQRAAALPREPPAECTFC